LTDPVGFLLRGAMHFEQDDSTSYVRLDERKSWQRIRGGSFPPPPICLQDRSMALRNVAILKLLLMAPANFQSSIAHQIGEIRQLWIVQITPDIILDICEILFARSCAKCVRKRPMRVSASDSSSTRPVDSTARTESNSLAISLEWLEDCVLQFWCAKIHRGLRKTGPPVTALFVCCIENEARRAPTVLKIIAMAAR